MCGIIGYIGGKSAVPILMSGLSRLEYRGYDSAGLATIVDGKVHNIKAKGKLSNLRALLEESPVQCTTGVGHTRWATHGAPSDLNAHPHCDCKGEISLIHNGIIENYLSIKKELETEGHTFISETDTEVLVHLIEHNYKGDIAEAVRKSLLRVEGSYAIGVVTSKEPGKIVAARLDSPLVIGLGRGENFIGSDIPAFLPYTRRVQHIQDREMVVLTDSSVEIFDLSGKKITRKVTEVHWDSAMAEKAGYRHFMLKEIYEQPRTIAETLKGRFDGDDITIEEMKLTNTDLADVNRIVITACGTAYHAGIVGKYFLEEYARIPVEMDVASEYRYRNPVLDDKTLVIAITQSGETADTLVSFRNAIAQGAKSIAITNVVGSSITRETPNLILTRAGLEIGVAATKTFTAQVTAMILLGLKIGRARGTISVEDFRMFREELHKVPALIEKILQDIEPVRTVARKYYKSRDFLFLGRSVGYPVALEGALKLKEISYIHAEGYAAGEMKHGPIALIDDMVPVVNILNHGPVFEKMLSNVKEVKARHAITIGIVNEGDESFDEYLDEIIKVPYIHPNLSPLLTTIPLQLLSYFIADKRDKDVDQPRNLAKSVTVE
ncbi:MAG: glutamine--fructose-6-phosphate transaminase (isomerizing) [Firmicutes bacterium]|nr:glutamine--fructose-6-phosphate transaminase (isomerizing) [Bacillota bacterium]